MKRLIISMGILILLFIQALQAQEAYSMYTFLDNWMRKDNGASLRDNPGYVEFLRLLTPEELGYVRNAIFAKKGHIFEKRNTNTSLNSAFGLNLANAKSRLRQMIARTWPWSPLLPLHIKIDFRHSSLGLTRRDSPLRLMPTHPIQIATRSTTPTYVHSCIPTKPLKIGIAGS